VRLASALTLKWAVPAALTEINKYANLLHELSNNHADSSAAFWAYS
jgi:hypothetical protein